jgi:hypothetical protein
MLVYQRVPWIFVETMMPTFVQFRNRSIIFQETKVGWIQLDYNGHIIVGII